MKNSFLLTAFSIAVFSGVDAQNVATVKSPDGRLSLALSCLNSRAEYSISYDGKTVLEKSLLGLLTDVDDFSRGVSSDGIDVDTVNFSYQCKTLKKSSVDVKATHCEWHFSKNGVPVFDIVFMVKNNDIAFRYQMRRLPGVNKGDSIFCAFVKDDRTHFNMPNGTTTFLSAQMVGGTGWSRTAPSYETPYYVDKPVGDDAGGAGFVFPCLFKTPDAWVLISETGVTSAYCASHLVCENGGNYKIANPMESDFNFIGTTAPGIPLPGCTPWRTITVGKNLAPIAETTIPWDFVEPLYSPSKQYTYGAGTWSWIIGFDESVNYKDQREYIDFTAKMGFVSVLVDNWWDTQIGRDSIAALSKYALSKGVSLMLWYNSNGYWNDAPQTPRNIMNNIIARRREMAWMKSIGIRGIKVDFFGSDKQQTMQLYEDILADANDYGLEVIFHGATLPRGWEKMYPNFIGSEAVLASENLHFGDEFCRQESYNATLHPLIRNSVASMDYGGVTFNDYFNTANDTTIWGGHRVTSDVFQMAVAVLFQCPLNHLALYPRITKDDQPWKIDFLKKVPTLWDDVKLIDAYPGKYLILARRHDHTWYVVAINADKEPLKRTISLPMLRCGITLYSDDASLNGTMKELKVSKKSTYEINVPHDGAAIFVGKE
jgi:hypothetical protein